MTCSRVDRRKPMYRDAGRPSAIVGLTVEGENLATIGARRVNRLLQLGKTALRKTLALASRPHGDLDAEHGLLAVFAEPREDDGITEPILLQAKPQSAAQAFRWRGFADIDLEILRRSKRQRAPGRLSATARIPAHFGTLRGRRRSRGVRRTVRRWRLGRRRPCATETTAPSSQDR